MKKVYKVEHLGYGNYEYLFIDEVQLTTKVIDKEKGGIEVSIYDMLNELKAYKNLDVYVTGSNSKGLSKDIATEFRGRATSTLLSNSNIQTNTTTRILAFVMLG